MKHKTKTNYTEKNKNSDSSENRKYEKWYEGDFRSKYPNGVLCWVGSNKEHLIDKAIIIEYISSENYFSAENGDDWKYARPVSLDEAPAIILNNGISKTENHRIDAE